MKNFLKNNLVQAIKARQLTIASFERLMGLKKNVVQNILRGTSKNPSVKTLQAIADALNWKLNDLVENEYHQHNIHQNTAAEQNCSTIDISLLESKNLFQEITEFFTNYIHQRSLQTKPNEFIETIQAIFNYCKSKNNLKFDKDFAEWVSSKYFKK